MLTSNDLRGWEAEHLQVGGCSEFMDRTSISVMEAWNRSREGEALLQITSQCVGCSCRDGVRSSGSPRRGHVIRMHPATPPTGPAAPVVDQEHAGGILYPASVSTSRSSRRSWRELPLGLRRTGDVCCTPWDRGTDRLVIAGAHEEELSELDYYSGDHQ